jgi:hypothetical protein
MQKDRTKPLSRLFSACVLMLPLALALATAHAAQSGELSGQWIGNSQVVGQKSIAKASLSLGAPDTDDSSLRIEGSNVCTLKHGSYTADASGMWSLSFKEGKGGDICARLAKGTFSLHRGSSPRALEFEATYPGEDGQQRVSRGALSRYP